MLNCVGRPEKKTKPTKCPDFPGIVNLTQRSLTANRDKYIVQRENVEQCAQN